LRLARRFTTETFFDVYAARDFERARRVPTAERFRANGTLIAKCPAVKEDIMRTQTSHPQHPGMLRHAALSAMLVCAGWFAGVSGVAAQDAAGQGADAVQASLGGAQADVAAAPSATVAATPERVAGDTSAQSASASENGEQASASNDDSVAIADNAASKKVFVTGSSVTRYDVASLDDRVLGNQHGRAVGMLMVAAVPDAFRNNSVTLWDEIAPPTQTPQQPIGSAAGAAQSGNIVNYTRK
jgi:hypothetical protein